MNEKNKCPCCGFYTLSDDNGHYDICPVCYWEDDPIQSDDIYYEGGANGICLKEARDNFKKIGAMSELFIKSVRPPLEDELPENQLLNKSFISKKEYEDDFKKMGYRKDFDMRKKIFLVFVIVLSFIILKINLFDKIDMNYKLILGKEFYIYNVFIDFMEDEAYPVLQQGANYKVRKLHYEYSNDTNEYGYVEKLSKYEDMWVGFIPSYESVTSRKRYFRHWYISDENEEFVEGFKNKMKNFEGYFVINKDIEKIGMSEEELLKYLNIKDIREIKFKDPNYYVQKYGGEKDLTPKYLNKNMEYLDIEKKKEKTIDQFKIERVIRIIVCIIFIFLGIKYLSDNKIFKTSNVKNRV